jgi:predicted MFS family arabinose efflux permease
VDAARLSKLNAFRSFVPLGLLFSSALFAYVDRSSVALILEPVKKEFQVTDALLRLLFGLPLSVGFALVGLPMSRWADHGDRPKILAFATPCFSAFPAAGAFASSLLTLVLV